MEKKEITLNVEGKSLGRAASEVASILRGKNSPSFQPNQAPDITLIVTGVNGLKLTGKKDEQMVYQRYSGYPGGLKKEAYKHLKDRRGMEHIFRETVDGMLARTRIKSKMLNNLIIK